MPTQTRIPRALLPLIAACLLPAFALAQNERASAPSGEAAETPEPAAYIIFHSSVTDYDALRQYGRAMVPVMERFGGRFLVLADQAEAIEGEPDTRRLAVIQFPSVQAARDFWDSEAYREAKALRADAGQFDVVLVTGLTPMESEE